MKIKIKKQEKDKDKVSINKSIDQVLTLTQLAQVLSNLKNNRLNLEKEINEITIKSDEDIQLKKDETTRSIQDNMNKYKIELARLETQLKMVEGKTPEIIRKETLGSIQQEFNRVNDEIKEIEKEVKRNHLVLPSYRDLVKNINKDEKKIDN